MTQWIDLLLNDVGLWVSELGVLLELVGAIVIVRAALRNRGVLSGLDQAFAYLDKLAEIRDAVRNQAITEVRGFVLLAVGLAFQFVGSLPMLPTS